MNPKESPQRAITVKAPFEGQPPADASASVFVFDPRGTLVASAPLKGGQASVNVPQNLGAAAHIVIGPTPQKTDKPATLDYLQRLRGYQPAVTIDPKSSSIELKPIPQALWQYWRWYLCRIRGKVIKSVGGVDRPVCNARVRVCEVEPFWLILQRLPDAQVLQLRDSIIKAVSTSPTLPLPPPHPVAENLSVAAKPLPPPLHAAELQAHVQSIVAANTLPVHTVSALASTSPSLVRNALLTNVGIYRPYFCMWPWWWWLFNRCEEIGTVMTDGQGNFDLDHWELDGDDEDLYFSVEYYIGGVWTKVYNPPLPCNVHWNYQCGSDVVIRITDPRVPACGGPPDPGGKSVVFWSIGHGASVHQIDPASGLIGGAPFGADLDIRVGFSRTELLSAHISQYRWSYRRMTLSDGVHDAHVPVTDFTHITTPISRHYSVPNPDPSLPPVTQAAPMGPNGHDELFQIQPLNPPPGGIEWVFASESDLATAVFKTRDLAPDPEQAAGLYELKLELFHDDGTRVNWNTDGVVAAIANVDDFSGPITSVVAPAAYRFFEGTDTVAMRWVLRVDNNYCQGNINDVQIPGGALGPCGFYTLPGPQPQQASVTVSFTASHPHNFATFAFNVARGSSGTIGALSAGGQVGDAADNGYTRSGTTFSRTYVAHDLFNLVDPGHTAPNCDRGAFAEVLGVYATATNGYGRLSDLDAPRSPDIGLKAFAVMPP